MCCRYSMPVLEHLSSACSCKALSGRSRGDRKDCRIFNCERCHLEVVICRHCDRGNRYCPPCAPLVRAEKKRASGAAYQKTEAGRLNHKVRQEHYRERLAENVTHHGDLSAALRQNSAVAALQGSQETELLVRLWKNAESPVRDYLLAHPHEALANARAGDPEEPPDPRLTPRGQRLQRHLRILQGMAPRTLQMLRPSPAEEDLQILAADLESTRSSLLRLTEALGSAKPPGN